MNLEGGHDLMFRFLNGHQAPELVRLRDLAFADRHRVPFEEAEDLVGDVGVAGLGALAGILERQHWETWLLSIHVVLRRDEALQEIAGDDIKYKRLLSDKLPLNIDYHPDWDGRPRN